MNPLFDSVVSNPVVDTTGLALGGAAVGLWLAAAWWTYADMSRRTTMELARLTAVAWVLLSTPALLPLALGAYLLARPQLTVAERRAQQLFEALAPSSGDGRCPGCGTAADPDWHRCPTCAAWIASSCSTCGEWSALGLDICPWCARDKVDGPLMGADDVAAATAMPAAIADEDVDSGSGRRIGLLPGSAAAAAARRPATPLPGNRGARDLRRTLGADRVAGSSRVGAGS
jgi:hypothetical protein